MNDWGAKFAESKWFGLPEPGVSDGTAKTDFVPSDSPFASVMVSPIRMIALGPESNRKSVNHS